MDLFDQPIAMPIATEASDTPPLAPAMSPPLSRDGFVATITLDAASKQAVWRRLRQHAPADAAFLANPALAAVIQHFMAIVWIRADLVRAALAEPTSTEAP